MLQKIHITFHVVAYMVKLEFIIYFCFLFYMGSYFAV